MYGYVYYDIAEGEDGILRAAVPNPAVGEKLLQEISTWMEEGCTMEDVVLRLRLRTVPNGYEPHNWCEGN